MHSMQTSSVLFSHRLTFLTLSIPTKRTNLGKTAALLRFSLALSVSSCQNDLRVLLLHHSHLSPLQGQGRYLWPQVPL